jgi:hypothetical protein
MTEDQIERRVEKMMDHLDRVFMAGGMSQESYDQAVRSLDEWAGGSKWPPQKRCKCRGIVHDGNCPEVI